MSVPPRTGEPTATPAVAFTEPLVAVVDELSDEQPASPVDVAVPNATAPATAALRDRQLRRLMFSSTRVSLLGGAKALRQKLTLPLTLVARCWCTR